jgi:predicted ferric reductase
VIKEKNANIFDEKWRKRMKIVINIGLSFGLLHVFIIVPDGPFGANLTITAFATALVVW